MLPDLMTQLQALARRLASVPALSRGAMLFVDFLSTSETPISAPCRSKASER